MTNNLRRHTGNGAAGPRCQKALEQQEGAYDQHLRQQKALEYQQAARLAAARFKVRTADR